MKKEALVSISEAGRLLGVSEQALRQWTDEGKIKAFITPGGHRRYLPAELRRFISANQKMLGVQDLVNKLEDTLPVLHDTATTYLRTTPWFGALNAESQEQLASLGRRLLNLIIQCVNEPSQFEETLKSVIEVGAGFGKVLAQIGLPLTDAVQTFIQHREPFTRITTEFLKKREGFDRRIFEAIPLVDRAIDQALVSLVEAHQKQEALARGKRKRDHEKI